MRTLAAMWFRRRPRAPEPTRSIPDPWVPPTNVRPVLLPPTEASYIAASGLDDQVRAMVQPDTLWDGSVPGYTAAQAVRTLASLRSDTARLASLDPAAVAPAAAAAAIASGALRAVLLLSGRTTSEAMRDDLSYVTYDMTRRLALLAESVGKPRSWAGATSRALWAGQVVEWSGFEVGADQLGGMASLAPLVGDLSDLRPLPGADPSATVLELVDPLLVAAVQRALRWAVVVAVVLLRPGTDPGSLDARLPRATGPAIAPSRPAIVRLREIDPQLLERYDALVQVGVELSDELQPSKRAGGHMDVRPDDEVVAGLLWRAATAVGAVALLGRRQLVGLGGPLAPLAGRAYDLLEAVSATGGSWPDEAVEALRQASELALILTASCHPGEFPPPAPLG